jgi:hypothetical protein
MTWSHGGRGRRWRFAGIVFAALVCGPVGDCPADEPAPGPARAEYERRKAAQEVRQPWSRALDERVRRWRWGGTFSEISAAVWEALARFPDEQAVALVVRTAEVINSSNAELAEGGPDDERLNAWCLDLALRALERLPRPPKPHEHLALVRRVHLAPTPFRGHPVPAVAPNDRRRMLAAVVGFLRRCHDEIDPLWDPRTPHSLYPPARPSDPRWRMGQGERGPADEGEFLRVEEAWYATSLARQDQREVRGAREELRLPSLLGRLARVFPPEPDVLRDVRAAAASVPEIDLVGLMDVQRQSQRKRENDGGEIDFRLGRDAHGNWSDAGSAGLGHQVILTVGNRTGSALVVPLGLVRAAVLYGDGAADESVLPPRREARPEDLVVVAPGRHAEFPLTLPLPRAGLARVVVVLQNDQSRVGATEAVWTGTERFVELVEVGEAAGNPGPQLRNLQEIATRAGLPVPEDLGAVTRMVAPLAEAWPDDRSVQVLSTLAKYAKYAQDDALVNAALDGLVAAAGRGYGESARFAFRRVAQDPERGFEQRVRAVGGLALFLESRRRAPFDASPVVRVVVDEPTDARVVTEVRARLEALTQDANHAVSAAARKALGQ